MSTPSAAGRAVRQLPLLLHRLPVIVERMAGRGVSRARPGEHVFPATLEQELAPFHSEQQPSPAAWEQLFRYFVHGWETYRLPHGAGASYPGMPSSAGRHADDREGFSRAMPLFAAWVSSGRDPCVRLADGRVVDLRERFATGLLAGTDPSSPGYWRRIRHYDKAVPEAADIALSLWLLRQHVWNELSAADRARITGWLLQVNGRFVHDHNWHLFVVMVNIVLASLGERADLALARRHYDRFVSFYHGDGWFSDGPENRFDYYNAWGMHYPLFWVREINPTWDETFLPQAQHEFLASYKHLIGPRGFPIMGRSVCYRFAVAAPLVQGHVLHPDAVSAGEARRALDCTWQHFIRHGALRGGTVSQGYCAGDDARVLDNYSGPASCLWSLRSLVAAFHLPTSAPFWSSEGEPLPVERNDFELHVRSTGWRISGRRDGAVITVRMPGRRHSTAPLVDHGPVRRALGRLVGPLRPRNAHAQYRRAEYRSDRPFCGCDE